MRWKVPKQEGVWMGALGGYVSEGGCLERVPLGALPTCKPARFRRVETWVQIVSHDSLVDDWLMVRLSTDPLIVLIAGSLSFCADLDRVANVLEITRAVA